MDFIISIVSFIIIFLLANDILLAVQNKFIKIESIMSMNKYFIYSIKFIGMIAIMFITSDILHINNSFQEGSVRGLMLALVCNVVSILIKEK